MHHLATTVLSISHLNSSADFKGANRSFSFLPVVSWMYTASHSTDQSSTQTTSTIKGKVLNKSKQDQKLSLNPIAEFPTEVVEKLCDSSLQNPASFFQLISLFLFKQQRSLSDPGSPPKNRLQERFRSSNENNIIPTQPYSPIQSRCTH